MRFWQECIDDHAPRLHRDVRPPSTSTSRKSAAAALAQYLLARGHGAETRTCWAMTFVPRFAGMIATTHPSF